jgi:hypothetical protein
MGELQSSPFIISNVRSPYLNSPYPNSCPTEILNVFATLPVSQVGDPFRRARSQLRPVLALRFARGHLWGLLLGRPFSRCGEDGRLEAGKLFRPCHVSLMLVLQTEPMA